MSAQAYSNGRDRVAAPSPLERIASGSRARPGQAATLITVITALVSVIGYLSTRPSPATVSERQQQEERISPAVWRQLGDLERWQAVHQAQTEGLLAEVRSDQAKVAAWREKTEDRMARIERKVDLVLLRLGVAQQMGDAAPGRAVPVALVRSPGGGD